MPAIDRLFDQLLDRGASDLHLKIGHAPTVRQRGDLVPLAEDPIDEDSMHALLDELLNESQRQIFATEHDLDFAYAYADKARFRANYLRSTSGPGAVFRTIPTRILSADELGLPPTLLRLVERRAGLVLVTGPTGSGKSTTLAAMLSHRNHQAAGHILTIEDPVEFVHSPARCQVTHREVGVDTPTYPDAIRSAGRENADVILIGELRGAQTMRLALQLASFGILILATVHTNSAAATIDRFVNSFPAAQQPGIRGMLADSVAGIVAQQLVKTADGRGRVAVHEILVGNTGVSAAIREAKTSLIPSLIQAGGRDGMQSMDAALERLVAQDKITASDALEKALDKDSFVRVPGVAAKLPAPAD
ncbi:MAG: PilT/PilU family type 4a pilus ATPase [Myxococcales bacterium FL481]|nr:MAG: PilT/PilU family type 4a pilus ATPase [Myxococcales bacterium FL481]